MDYHKAIRAIHNSVITVDGNTEKTIVAKDKNGKSVNIDWTKVNAWKDPNEYQYKRELEYPPFTDYLDGIVKDDKEQIESYIAACKAIKLKYPKK